MKLADHLDNFNCNINISRRSMIGILLIFEWTQANRQRDPELFANPGIVSVDI